MTEPTYDPVSRRVRLLMDAGYSREEAWNVATEEWQDELHGEGDWEPYSGWS